MTLSQVRWAKQHDWFRFESTDVLSGWWVHVQTYVYDSITEEFYEETKAFKDFKELKIWAGY